MLATLLGHDLRLQYRYGIYAAYAAVIAVYAGTLVAMGPAMPDWAVALIVFSDPSALGFIFLGGLMLLEKGEGARAALAVSPLSARVYLLSKTTTLTGLALLAVIVLALAKSGLAKWELLLPAVILTSTFYIGIGTAFALRFRTVNGYLLGSVVLMFPLIAPATLALFEPMPPILILIPSVAQFRLMLIAFGFGTAGATEIIAMLAISIVTALAGLAIGERALRRELGWK